MQRNRDIQTTGDCERQDRQDKESPSISDLNRAPARNEAQNMRSSFPNRNNAMNRLDVSSRNSILHRTSTPPKRNNEPHSFSNRNSFPHDRSQQQQGLFKDRQGEQRVCNYFGTPQKCYRGDRCPFVHDLKRVACPDWRRGRCPYGNNCRYGHFYAHH